MSNPGTTAMIDGFFDEILQKGQQDAEFIDRMKRLFGIEREDYNVNTIKINKNVEFYNNATFNYPVHVYAQTIFNYSVTFGGGVNGLPEGREGPVGMPGPQGPKGDPGSIEDAEFYEDIKEIFVDNKDIEAENVSLRKRLSKYERVDD